MDSQIISNNIMQFKDGITVFTLIITIISSHWLASKQARKTKRAKWIEDFRSEVANLLSISMEVEKANIQSLFNLSKCSYVVMMLLDNNKQSQLALIEEISVFGNFMMDGIRDENFIKEYRNRVSDIVYNAKSIIREEEKRL